MRTWPGLPNLFLMFSLIPIHLVVGKDQQKEYRIKPWPDPERQSSTTWMTKRDIDVETLKPSKFWIEAGTGDLGKVYVEVLSCTGLPNLDFSISGRDKSDPFACLVFEDSVVNTDVINDCLSPRWLPWAQRAFIFNIRHPSSQLMIGVFDEDMASSHDFVGRAVINLSNLRTGTVYTTTYVLYNSQNEHRHSRGTITLRLRMDLSDARKTLLAGAVPTIYHDVSVAKREHFRVVYDTITHGVSHELTIYDLTSFERLFSHNMEPGTSERAESFFDGSLRARAAIIPGSCILRPTRTCYYTSLERPFSCFVSSAVPEFRNTK